MKQNFNALFLGIKNVKADIPIYNDCKWGKYIRKCTCLVTWFCYQMIAKPGQLTRQQCLRDLNHMLVSIYKLMSQWANINFHCACDSCKTVQVQGVSNYFLPNPNIQSSTIQKEIYCQTSNIRRPSVGNIIVENSDVVGASPVGAAPNISESSTYHMANGLGKDKCKK